MCVKFSTQKCSPSPPRVRRDRATMGGDRFDRRRRRLAGVPHLSCHRPRLLCRAQQYAGGRRRRKNGIEIVRTIKSPPPLSLSRASSKSSESSERELALLPEDSADALYRYRKVMSVLFALGGSLHAPDVFGNGPLSSLNDVHAFGDLPRLAQCVTLLWAIGGPAAALAASKNLPVADVMIGCIASCEILVGVGFKTGHGVNIPEPIVMAQVVNVASAIGLRLWEKNEKKEKEGEEDGES